MRRQGNKREMCERKEKGDRRETGGNKWERREKNRRGKRVRETECSEENRA